jgi:hypothetical protein
MAAPGKERFPATALPPSGSAIARIFDVMTTKVVTPSLAFQEPDFCRLPYSKGLRSLQACESKGC